jgi:hypothetical protein
MFSVFTNARGALPSGRWSSHALLSLQSVLRTMFVYETLIHLFSQLPDSLARNKHVLMTPTNDPTLTFLLPTMALPCRKYVNPT